MIKRSFDTILFLHAILCHKIRTLVIYSCENILKFLSFMFSSYKQIISTVLDLDCEMIHSGACSQLAGRLEG